MVKNTVKSSLFCLFILLISSTFKAYARTLIKLYCRYLQKDLHTIIKAFERFFSAVFVKGRGFLTFGCQIYYLFCWWVAKSRRERSVPLVPGVAVAAALPCFQHTLTSKRRKKRLPLPLFLFRLRFCGKNIVVFLFSSCIYLSWVQVFRFCFVLNKVWFFLLSLRNVIWCIFSKLWFKKIPLECQKYFAFISTCLVIIQVYRKEQWEIKKKSYIFYRETNLRKIA